MRKFSNESIAACNRMESIEHDIELKLQEEYQELPAPPPLPPQPQVFQPIAKRNQFMDRKDCYECQQKIAQSTMTCEDFQIWKRGRGCVVRYW